MSIWNTLKTHAKAQFLDVIEWLDDSRDTLVYRFPIFNQAIQDGGKLVVREGQAAVFISEGQLSDVFGPGTYELSTRNTPIASFFSSIKYQLNYPFKGDVYFVNTTQFPDQKWGTPNPVMMNDGQLGPVRIRAFGNYSYRVTDPGKFLRELVGTSGLYTTGEINGQLKRKLVSGFADTLGEAKIPVLELAAKYMDLGDTLRGRMTGWFEENYGITLTDFVVENVSLPKEVEKMLDKRTSMGLIGDMGAYTQFQAANAIENAASNPGGGGSNPMMEAGMGMAMGNVMGNQMMGAQQGRGNYNPQHGMQGTPPPPPTGPAKLHYNGPGGQGQYTIAEIASMVGNNRSAQHHVWAAGWPAWKNWNEVPEIASMVPPAAPGGGGAATFHYNGPDGQAQLTADAIANKVKAAPDERHLVWQSGWANWKSADEVPEISSALSDGPPPPPADDGPPPPPQ